MKKLTSLLLTFLFIFAIDSTDAQEPVASDIIEVGWIDHLDETIPLDLQFYNEQNDTVTLRKLIDKPTIKNMIKLHKKH